MSISYIPEQQGYKEITPFKRFVLQSFPWIDANFDSLTNYELMGKIIEYLNDVISNENTLESNMSNLYDSFVELHNYVENYFDDLDVQNEINAKLDKMAQTGELSALIGEYVDPIFEDYQNDVNSNINTFRQQMATLTNRIDGLESLQDGSTTGDAELADIRIAEDGLTYASAGTSVRTQIRDRIENEKITNDYFSTTIPSIIAAFSSTDLETETTSTNRFASPILNLNGTYLIECDGYQFNLYRKKNDTTQFVTQASNGILQYTFDNSYIYRLLGKKEDGSTITASQYFKLKKLDTNIEMTDLKSKLNIVDRVDRSNKKYIKPSYDLISPSPLEIENNKFYSKINGVETESSGSQTITIDVKPNEDYYVTGQAVSNLAGVIFWTSTKTFISYDIAFTDDTRHAFYDNHVIVPPACYKMSVQTRDRENYPIIIKKYQSDFVYTFDSMTALKQNAYINKKLGYKLNTLDKCYISITVDDSNVDIDVIAKLLYNSYGYPLNLATIPSKLYNNVTGTQGIGSNVLMVNKYVQEHGGEILTHNSQVITNSNYNNFETMYDIFSNSKRLLENEGLQVKGIILSGGTGEIRNDTTDIWSRMYYQYGDRYGSDEPYYHPRTNIAKTDLNTLKSMIDSAVTNKEWLSLSFHGLADYGITTDGNTAYANGFTTDDLIVILNYIKTYTDNNDAAVVRYGYVYDNFSEFDV